MGNLASTNSYESVSSNKSVVSSNEELGSSCGGCHQAGDVQKDLKIYFYIIGRLVTKGEKINSG